MTNIQKNFASFGGRLRSVCEKKGLNQKELADLIGVSKNTISAYITGGQLPNGEKLIALAGAIQVSLDWLLLGTTPPTPAADPGEAARLRQELSTAQTRIEALTDQLTEASKQGGKHVRWALDEQEKRQKLEADLQALRAQVAAATMGPEEGKLLVRAGELLSIPGAPGLDQVLGRVVEIFGAAERAKSPPTIQEGGQVQKSEGDGGGPEEKSAPPRANSSL